MLHITKYKYLNGYKLELTFDNETNGIADFEELVQDDTVFEPLKNINVYAFYLANKSNPKYYNLFKEWGYLV